MVRVLNHMTNRDITLNLVERFWKFVKKQCLYSKYYPEFADFKAAILHCIDQVHEEHKEKLESLLILNFKSPQKVEVMPV